MRLVSVIIPVLNEEESLPELWNRLDRILHSLPYSFEVIFIDDGSTDGSWEFIKKLARDNPSVRGISFRRTFRKSAALSAGFEAARGEFIVTMDADLQHEPEEIPAMLKKLAEGYDIVTTWRHKRRDNLFTRRIPSWIANRIIALVSGIKLHDFGGTFHAYRAEVLEGLELYSELHRFIPALVSWSGRYRIYEHPIHNPPRKHGTSHYGLGRILKVLFDIITVKYFTSYISRALEFFGLIGLFFLLLGCGGSLFVAYRKLIQQVPIAYHGPLFLVSIFLLGLGIQFVLFGILGEVSTRIYYASTGRKTYTVREEINGGEGAQRPSIDNREE
ncbi:MAG: glycosyltransferase [Candidatus Hydrogenedentota bacterium]|nr:MAG: glycosyltransferase [Candidatus Hydrogenedentota bacterium]